MKRKIAKVFLWISLLPYALLIFNSVGAAINGYSLMFSEKTYGFEAFFDSLVLAGYLMIVGAPILPICFIYQMVYLFIVFKDKD